MTLAAASGIIQSRAIVIGNAIRNMMAPAAQAAAQAGKRIRRSAKRSCLSAASAAMESPRTSDGATRLVQNLG